MTKALISKYNHELALRILERLAQGETLSQITKDPALPSRATFYRWLFEFPDLSKAYEEARTQSATALEEEMLDIARELRGENEFTALKTDQLKTVLSQYRWSATRRDPRRFTERKETAVVVPIQINTTLDLGQGTATGTKEHPNVYHIEAKVMTPVEGEVLDGEVLPAAEIGDTVPPVDPGPLRLRSPDKGGGQRKGPHKSERDIKRQITRNRNRGIVRPTQ